MKKKFWLCKRCGIFYVFDSEKGRRTSLRTGNREEAQQILHAKNQAAGKPALGLALAKAYLSAYDETLCRRTWQDVMKEFCSNGCESTQTRRKRSMGSKPFDLIRHKPLLETTSDDLRAVMKTGGVSTNHFIRCLHNLAVGMGWLPWPIIPQKLWPSVETKPKRGITMSEHEAIIAAEKIQSVGFITNCSGKLEHPRATQQL